MTQKQRLKNQGRSQRWLAVQLKRDYTNICKYLNKPEMMPEHIRNSIEEILKVDERKRK